MNGDRLGTSQAKTLLTLEQTTAGMRFAVGTRFGPYEILTPLGKGGMGEVHHAYDERLERSVALKIVTAATDDDLRARFVREAQAVAKVEHPHVCRIYDLGRDHDVDYLVMEYLEGETLVSRLSRGPLPAGDAITIAGQVAEALAHTHDHGLVHRDLKPGNVMLTGTGAKVLDVGLSGPISAETATVRGTLQYLSPEQIDGQAATPQSDLFALGAILYEMLAGRHAFAGENASATIAAILHHDPPPLPNAGGHSPDLAGMVSTCLAKNPADRWPSARALAEALRALPQRPRRRRRWIATMVVALTVALAMATVSACRQQVSATPLREDPELANRLAIQDQERKRFEAARDMTPEQADALEQRLDVNPEDFEARRQLVTYYRTSSTVAWDKKVPGLRRHALWLIEHHPDHDVQAPALSPQFDPEGFAAAKKLWEAHLAKPGVPPFLVYRAASFFAPHDKPFAEQLILRGMAMDPDSAATEARMQLSSLYAAALRGSESAWGTHHDLRTHLDQVTSAYAMQVRGKLEATTDAQLLVRVGGILVRPNQSTRNPALRQALDEVRALGVRYLERALELDPNLEMAKALLVRVRLPERATDADRLANRAHEGYMVAEDITEYARKDMVAGKQQRDEARARAEEVVKIAAAHPREPAYSAAVMTAQHVLATAALRDGDRERAVHHLRESVNVPVSEQIQYAPPSSWLRPVHRLLNAGEREAVVEFLEAFARLTINERDRLLKDAQTIREGRMPSSYQHMVAREGR